MERGATPQLFFFCKLMVLYASIKTSVFDFSLKVYYPKWAFSQIVLIRHSKLQVHQGIDLEWLVMLQNSQPLFIRKISSVMSGIHLFLSSPTQLTRIQALPTSDTHKSLPSSILHLHPLLWASVHTHTHTHTHTQLCSSLTFKAPNHLSGIIPTPIFPLAPHYHHQIDVPNTPHSYHALNRFSMPCHSFLPECP